MRLLQSEHAVNNSSNYNSKLNLLSTQAIGIWYFILSSQADCRVLVLCPMLVLGVVEQVYSISWPDGMTVRKPCFSFITFSTVLGCSSDQF